MPKIFALIVNGVCSDAKPCWAALGAFGKTHRKAIERGLLLLRKSGAKLAGFVLNRLTTGRAASYYYYYYGDKYEKDSAYGSAT
jgi:hypothetical protein